MRPILTLLLTLVTLVALAALATPGAFAADLGDQCKTGFNVSPQYLCPAGTVCLKAIGKMYCSAAGKVCGWSGTSGYNLGQKKTYQGKSYECTPSGFQRSKAQLGDECRTGMNVPRQYLCENGRVCLQAIDKKYCSQPGKVCGWSGTSGYNLGQTRTHQGKTYDCTPTGFQEETAGYQMGAVTTLPASPKTRRLNSAESSIARRVFGRSLNLGQVRVTNTVGLESRPWTTNTPPTYTVNVGTRAFQGMEAREYSGLLIHELAHVWQGQHGVPFMSNSALHQTLAAIESGGDTGKAYDFEPGKQWNKYNSEQQASIVERWFLDGRRQSSPLYPYIRDNVRPGRPNATTQFQQRGRR